MRYRSRQGFSVFWKLVVMTSSRSAGQVMALAALPGFWPAALQAAEPHLCPLGVGHQAALSRPVLPVLGCVDQAYSRGLALSRPDSL